MDSYAVIRNCSSFVLLSSFACVQHVSRANLFFFYSLVRLQTGQEVLVWKLHQSGERGADLCSDPRQTPQLYQSRHCPGLSLCGYNQAKNKHFHNIL